MAKITIQKGKLKVSVPPLQAFAALRSSFEIPLGNVRGATHDDNYLGFSEMGLRSPGAAFPGFIAMGTFRKSGQKLLSFWKRGQQVVVIELANSKWDRVIIGTSDADALVAEINKAVLAG